MANSMHRVRYIREPEWIYDTHYTGFVKLESWNGVFPNVLVDFQKMYSFSTLVSEQSIDIAPVIFH